MVYSALLVQESDDLRFCNVHIDALRSAHKQIDRFIISLLPKEETTWWQRQKTTFWASVSITLDSMSKSLIWNQFIHIPGLFSYDPFHETGDLNSTASYRPIGGRLESFTPAVGAQIAPHERIWTVFGSSWQYRHRLILVTFSGVAGCVYGSVHAVKWNQQFPTMAERRMWQISCCMGLLGVLPVIAFGLTGFSPMWIKTEERRRWFNALCIICGLVMTVCFIFARSFLVVESLLALRNMPASAYATVKWLDFWKSGLSVGQQ